VVISAGEDLTEPGHAIDAEHSYESNSWLLTTAVREAEAIGYRVHTIPDTAEELKDLIEDQLVRADLVVISSGPRSVEMMRVALDSLGQMHEREIAMEPSGHHSYGLIGPDRTPVITVPSGSSAAYISCELFVRPMIRQMLGRKVLSHRVLPAQLAGITDAHSALVGASATHRYLEALITHRDEVLFATPTTEINRAEANGLILLGRTSTASGNGDEVEVMVIDRRAD
jgi:molybdopterin biosynthesis enzyme